MKTDDPEEVNFRRGVRNPLFADGEWDKVDPPAPEECGTLLESHEGVSAALLEAGNHGARRAPQRHATARAVGCLCS